MRLALLGLDETTLALVRAAQSTGQDEIVLACEITRANTFTAELPELPAPQAWEALYELLPDGRRICDAVLVARDDNDEARLEQLRKLAQEGIPVLVAHPVHASMLAYYELDMIRRDTSAHLVPCLPDRRHPLAARLQRWIAEHESLQHGVDRIVLEREMRHRTRSAVVSQFARDVDLLRFLAGDITRLGAMGSPGASAQGEPLAYGNLSVQMAGAGPALMRWTVAPVENSPRLRLTASGNRGKAVLTLPDDLNVSATLELVTDSGTNSNETSVWNPDLAALDELRAALAGQADSRWPDAAKSVELAETIDRSLAKGRTIELHQEEFSDISTFKGTMTSLGCGLLLLALVLVVIGTMTASLLRRAGALGAAELVSLIPYFLVSLFAVFLAAQAVLKLVGRNSD